MARRITVRLTGAAIATGGLALMGIGTMGAPAVSGGATQFASSDPTTVLSITAVCSGSSTTGTVTVSSPQAGETLTLTVFVHTTGGGDDWTATTASTTITLNATDTTYSYTISGLPPLTGNENAYRVQITGHMGNFVLASLNTKSPSYACGAASTTSSTASSSTSSSSTSSSTSSSSSSTTSTAPGSSTTSVPGSTSTVNTSVTSSGAGAGVLGAGTTTPSTGADLQFGLGLGLMIGGGALAFGAGPLFRRRKK